MRNIVWYRFNDAAVLRRFCPASSGDARAFAIVVPVDKRVAIRVGLRIG